MDNILERMMANDPQIPDRLHAAATAVPEQPTGFVAMAANDIRDHSLRLGSSIERLNELGARLIGPDQLPRNNRPKVEQVLDDAPEPIRSDTEQVTRQMSRLSNQLDDLQELVSFLEQL